MKSSPAIRFVDKHVGTICCAVLSLFPRLFRRRDEGVVRNVLFIELFEMGASIMAYPSVHHVLKQHPGAKIYVLTTRGIRASWLKIAEIPPEQVLALEDSSIFAFLFSFLGCVRRINALAIDVIIDLELFLRITALFCFCLKATRKAGFYRYNLEGLYRGSLHDVQCHFNQNSHISRNFLALTKTALAGTADYPEHKNAIPLEELTLSRYQSKPEIFEELAGRLGLPLGEPYVVVAPDVGANLSVRNYPIDRLAVVLQRLLANRPELGIYLIGTVENEPICNQLVELVADSRTVSLAGKTSMDELFELLVGSSLLISNDNGPVHFAALTDTPTLALYSTDSPFVYGSLGRCLILYSYYQCSPCIMAYNNKNSSCVDNKCLQAILPETVLDGAMKVLEGTANFRTINDSIPYLF